MSSVNAGYRCDRFTGMNATKSTLPPQPPLRNHLPVPVIPQGLDLPPLLLWKLQQTQPLGYPVRGVNAGYRCDIFAGLNATLQSLPSQFTLRHHPSVPVVSQGLDLLLLFLRQLEQAEPLRDPIRGDAVPLPELRPGEVVPEQFCLQFPGEDQWIPVGTSAGYGNVRAQGFQGERSP